MKRKTLAIHICSLLLIGGLSGCDSSGEKTELTNALSSAIETVESVVVTSTNNGSEQEVMLIAEAVFAAGCESWKKDDDISFEIHSKDNDFEAEIGIVSVLNNGGYDEIYSETIVITTETKNVTIKVPNDGDYGLYYKNNSKQEVAFIVNLNKELIKPLV